MSRLVGSPDAFARGLRAWAAGDESDDAETAGEIVADLILDIRGWIAAEKARR